MTLFVKFNTPGALRRINKVCTDSSFSCKYNGENCQLIQIYLDGYSN